MPQRPHKSAFFILICPVISLFDIFLPFSNTVLSNVVSSLNCLLPDYPTAVSYSRIRSSKNQAIFYSKLIEPAGGFELDSNRANTAVNQHYLSPLQITASDPRISNIASQLPDPLSRIPNIFGVGCIILHKYRVERSRHGH